MAADIYARVGAAIRTRRGAAGLTQATLASETGLSRSSITNIENGGQAILLHQLLDLARVLGADPCELLVSVDVEDARAAGDPVGTGTGRATELLARLGPVGGSRSR